VSRVFTEREAGAATPLRPEDAPELSAIVLCYRAGESILRVIDPLNTLLCREEMRYELVLVANYWAGQHDPTPPIVERFAVEHEHVTAVVEEKQGSMGWDMRAGFRAARGAYLIVIDGDAQNPVSDVLEMYRQMRATGADVMKGRRIIRHDGTYRRFISIAYNLLFRLFFRTRGIWDINGKPKGLTRSAYEQMELHSDDWFIDAEIVLKARGAHLMIQEMPVVFHRNEERASFVRFSAIWEFVRNMLNYRFRGIS
jgi:glycosyltransferase involved in cell wall biosynthesis